MILSLTRVAGIIAPQAHVAVCAAFSTSSAAQSSVFDKLGGRENVKVAVDKVRSPPLQQQAPGAMPLPAHSVPRAACCAPATMFPLGRC